MITPHPCRLHGPPSPQGEGFAGDQLCTKVSKSLSLQEPFRLIAPTDSIDGANNKKRGSFNPLFLIHRTLCLAEEFCDPLAQGI